VNKELGQGFNLKSFHENEDVKAKVQTDVPPSKSNSKQFSIKELSLDQSFLRKEAELAQKIEIAINPNIKSQKPNKKVKSTPEVVLPKYLFPSIILITLATVWAVVYIFIINVPFFSGKWEGNLTDAEKIQGIRSLSYNIDTDVFKEEIKSEVEGLSFSATLVSKVEITGENGKTLSFHKINRRIEGIKIDVPPILCVKSSCEEIKKSFEKTFQDEIVKQNTKINGTVFHLSKRSEVEMQLDSDIETARILTKIK
jgi:hypothetical protein